MDNFIETTKEFKKLDEVDDAKENFKSKKNAFEAWSTLVFMRVSDKRKYEELINDLSVKYAIKNNKYTKTLHKAVDVMRKVKSKSKNNHDKSSTEKQNKNGGGERDKSIETSFHKHNNMKKCY